MKSSENVLTLDTFITVQFCPSGEVQSRSIRWVLENKGLNQLAKIRKGIQLSCPVFMDSAIMTEDESNSVLPLP